MKLADALVWALNQWKIPSIFGVSGANIEHLHDAIIRAPGGVKSILAKSEVGAAFMADGQARAHNTLGVCCATSGGGMMNLAVGIAESWADRVPILAIVGQVPTHLEGRGGFQDSSSKSRGVDAVKLFQSIAKFVARLDQPALFWPTLEQAARQALSGVMGPAVLLIPREAFEHEVPPPPESFPITLDDMATIAKPDFAKIEQLFLMLKQARNPVFVAGRNVGSGIARQMLTRFASLSNIPVASTMGCPTAFPHDHPLYLGCVGAAGHPSAHAYLKDTADLIVAFASDLDIMTRQPWAEAFGRACIAAVGRDVAQVAQNITVSHLLPGEPAEVLRGLLALHEQSPFTQTYPGNPLRRYAPITQKKGEALLQSEAIALLEPHMPKAGHVFFDAGNCASAAIHGLSLQSDCQGLVALGMGGMGYAIAGAIGAQLMSSAQNRSVVISGDGAFLMLGLEAHTAIELQLPILFIFFNDAKHGMCVTRQQVFFEGRIDTTTYNRVDIAAVTRGLAPADRLWVAKAKTVQELKAALADFATNPYRPSVLELELTCEEMPPFAPFLPKDAKTFIVKRPLQNCLAK